MLNSLQHFVHRKLLIEIVCFKLCSFFFIFLVFARFFLCNQSTSSLAYFVLFCVSLLIFIFFNLFACTFFDSLNAYRILCEKKCENIWTMSVCIRVYFKKLILDWYFGCSNLYSKSFFKHNFDSNIECGKSTCYIFLWYGF